MSQENSIRTSMVARIIVTKRSDVGKQIRFKPFELTNRYHITVVELLGEDAEPSTPPPRTPPKPNKIQPPQTPKKIPPPRSNPAPSNPTPTKLVKRSSPTPRRKKSITTTAAQIRKVVCNQDAVSAIDK